MPVLPIARITMPADMANVENGKLPPHLLAKCGIANFDMHHLAARSMRALAAAARRAGFEVTATGTLRSYERQRQMFDGTNPANRTKYEGRYIPEHLWHTVGQATFDHGDIRVWQNRRWKRRKETAAAAVPGQCLEEGTVILTRRGLIPIEEILVGDEVWTHKYRWRPVTDVQGFEKQVMKMAGAAHPGMYATAEHRWFVVEDPAYRKRGPKGGPVVVKQTNEVEGDLWLVPTTFDEQEVELSPELLRFAGAWVADGTYHAKKDGTVAGIIYPRNAKAEVVIEWMKAAGIKPTEWTDRGDGVRRIGFESAAARWLGKEFGKKSTERTIPSWLVGNRKLSEAFLEGYLHGDGHWRAMDGKTPQWQIHASSRRLVVGLTLLGRTVGWYSRLSGRRWPPTCIVKGKVCTPTAEAWTAALYPEWPESNERIWSYDADSMASRISRVEEVEGVRTVYDITVAEDESFIADGIISHNSNHGLGIAIDFTSPTSAFLNWLIANAHLYGYSWELKSEPWHLRYVAGDSIPRATLDYEASIAPPVTPPVAPPVVTPLPPPLVPQLPPFIPEEGKWGLMPLVAHLDRPNLDLGSGFGTGPDRDWVRYVQAVLALKCGYSQWIKPHGLYDELTKAAVSQVQGSPFVALYPDGKVNFDDWKWIDAAAAA